MPKFKFSLKSKDKKARAGILETRHGIIKTPVFMPVGTHGSVKGIFPKDLNKLEIEIILANTYHLMLRPGESLIQKMGGIQKFISWNKPVLTDSGGYQVWSLSKLRKINEEYTPWQMAEGDTIELEHPLTGSVLLETWGVPIAVRDPIIYHLNPTESQLNPQAAHLLHYADYLSRLRGNNCVEGEPEPYLDPATRTTLGLPEDDSKIIELLKTEFENASEFFELIRSEG